MFYNFYCISYQLNQEDYDLMQQLKSYWSSSNWNTQNSNPCQWNGVTCDNQQDHVIELFVLI